MGDINTSDLFLCGVIVNEHGDPVIGVPISNIAVNRIGDERMENTERKREGKKNNRLLLSFKLIRLAGWQWYGAYMHL